MFPHVHLFLMLVGGFIMGAGYAGATKLKLHFMPWGFVAVALVLLAEFA